MGLSLRWNDCFHLGAEVAVIAKCGTGGYNEGLSLFGTNSNACGGSRDMATFKVNGVEHTVDVEADMPLLWVLRDELGMTGTKFGCGIASCGACTVHVNGSAVRSCVLPVSAVEGQDITTIEGLAQQARTSSTGVGTFTPTSQLSAVQQAWIDHQVPQCGYCQSGMIMAVSSLLASNPNPSDAEIDASINNVCRCGSYPRVRRAIRSITA
jgi:isoquinoline 1-oxidoreductase alpha subunit